MGTGSPDEPGLAVVYLAVRELGRECFDEFVESYRTHPAGRAHRLVIVAKQFGSSADFAPWQRELEGIDCRVIFAPDEGLDIGAYFHAARNTRYRQYCFLNSRSVILAPGWLEKLVRALDLIPQGVVAATGSWDSISSNALQMVYPGVVKPFQPVRALLGYLKLLPYFPSFPNPYVRTNCFVISRETMLSLRCPQIYRKMDAWRFESGRNSFTRQILATGAAALLVDADGRAYPVADWQVSGTFWQGEQERLLVADKQTRMYRDADAATRRQLQRAAWNSY